MPMRPPAPPPIAPIKYRQQVPVGEGQQPDAHTALIALLAFALQIHLALTGTEIRPDSGQISAPLPFSGG